MVRHVHACGKVNLKLYHSQIFETHIGLSLLFSKLPYFTGGGGGGGGGGTSVLIDITVVLVWLFGTLKSSSIAGMLPP